MKQVIKSLGPYSQFIFPPANSKPVYFSGVVGINQETNSITAKTFEEELRTVFQNLDTNFAAAGIQKTNVIKVTVYLTDMERFDELNKIYAEYFDGHKPCRVCIAVSAIPKKAQVELDVTVHL